MTFTHTVSGGRRFRVRRQAVIPCVLCAAALLFGSCARQVLPPQTTLVMNTVCTINLFEAGTQELYDTIAQRLTEIDAAFNAHDPASLLSAVNAAAGTAPVRVNGDLLAVIEAALSFARLTGGAFDPSIGPLVRLWNIGSEHPRVPAPHETAAAAQLVNYQNVIVDRAAGTVFLTQKGMSLDLGGIAKGYAADEIVRILKQAQVPSALIDLGGNIYAYGKKAGGAPWKIGIKNPFDTSAAPAAALSAVNKTIVTSGVYERYFIEDGVRYHHLIDPHTGYPAQNGTVSVTIAADSSLNADALSTAVFILGAQKGFELLSSAFPDTGAAIITDDRRIYMNQPFLDLLDHVSPEFAREPPQNQAHAR